MSSSSGIGEDVGRTPEPSIFERETRAIVDITRERLGIVVDTLQVSFTELGGQIWKYQASANRPVLPPLGSTRMQTDNLGKEDASVKAFFEELLNTLPTIVRQKLEYDRAQTDRDPSYLALEEVLTTTAKALAWISAGSAATAPGSIEERYAEANAFLPFFAAGNTTKAGQEFFDNVRTYLDERGANYTHTDKLSNTTRQAQFELYHLQKELESYGN